MKVAFLWAGLSFYLLSFRKHLFGGKRHKETPEQANGDYFLDYLRRIILFDVSDVQKNQRSQNWKWTEFDALLQMANLNL